MQAQHAQVVQGHTQVVASQLLNTIATVHALLAESQHQRQTEASVGAATIEEIELLRAEKVLCDSVPSYHLVATN